MSLLYITPHALARWVFCMQHSTTRWACQARLLKVVQAIRFTPYSQEPRNHGPGGQNLATPSLGYPKTLDTEGDL